MLRLPFLVFATLTALTVCAHASPIEVHVVAAEPSANGTRLELTVAALVEGKPPPKTPSIRNVGAITGTARAEAIEVRSIATERRAVTLLLDTGALPPPDGVVHRAVGAFLDARPPTEALQIVSVSHEPSGLDAGWTTNREDLATVLKAVRIPRRPGSLLFEAVGLSLEGIANAPGLPRQRAVILLSDGLDSGSEPPWTFDYVRGLAEDGGVPILSVFVPPMGRSDAGSARRALAVLSERSGGRVVDLPGHEDAWRPVDAASLERALLQAGALLDGLYVVTLRTGSLPAGRLTGELDMLGTRTPFNVPLSAPVIAPDDEPAPAEPGEAPTAPAGLDPLVLVSLALLGSAVIAFVVARRTSASHWDEFDPEDTLPPPDWAPPPPEPLEPELPPEGGLLDPVPNASVTQHGGWGSASISHRGPREQNEDFLGSAHHPLRVDRAVFVVADGMGGHNGGYQASRVAVDAVLRAFAASAPDDGPDRVLPGLVDAANKAVHDLAASDPRFEGCGTTLVLLLTEPDRVHHAHVGDSRIYLLRGGVLTQLTEDHTLLRVLVRAGAMTAAEAALDPRGHVLSQAIGSSWNLDIDVTVDLPVGDADRFLLCSDGLSGVLSDVRMAEVASAAGDAEAVKLLVMDALNAGTADNTTVSLVSRV